MAFYDSVLRGLGLKRSKKEEEAAAANARIAAQNAARFQAEGRFGANAVPGAAARQVASDPGRYAAAFGSKVPQKSFLSRVADEVTGIGREFNPARQYADIAQSATDRISGVPVLGDVAKDVNQHFVQNALRPIAAVGEIIKGNQAAAWRQIDQSPLSRQQREIAGRGGGAAEQFFRPAVSSGAVMASYVAPAGKAAQGVKGAGTLGAPITKSSVKSLAGFGATANTLYEGGKQLESGKVDPASLAVAPVAGAVGGVAAKPVAKAGMGTLRAVSPKIAGKGAQAAVNELPRLPLGTSVEPPTGVTVSTRAPGKVSEVVGVLRTGRVATNSPEQVVTGKTGNTLAGMRDKTLQAAREREQLYNVGKAAASKNAIMRTFDPDTQAERIDHAYADQQGIKYRDLRAEDRMTQALNDVRNSDSMATAKIYEPTSTGLSAADVMQQHSNGDLMFYLTARRDLRVRRETGDAKKILGDYSTEDLTRAVKEFEQQNPDHATLKATLNEVSDNELRQAVKDKRITEQDYKLIKAYYGDEYIPVGHIMPEGTLRPEISGNTMTMSRQKAIQAFEGNSDAPVDLSYDPLINYVKANTRESNKARASKMYYERTKSGAEDTANILMSVEQSASREAGLREMQALSDLKKKLQSKVRQLSAKSRVENVRTQQAEDIAMQTAKTKLKQVIPADDAGAQAAVDSLTREQLIAALDDLTGTKIVSRQAKNARAYSQSLQQAIYDTRKAIEGVSDTRRGVADQLFRIEGDQRGKQVLTMLVDGQQVKLEITPEVSRMLQRFDEKKLNSVLMGLTNLQRVFQTTWTGFLNVVFPIQSFLFYDVLPSIANARGGTGLKGLVSPSAVTEMVKSFSKNSEFQRLLHLSGANITPGSGIPISTNLSTEKIVSGKNLGAKAAYNVKHFKEGIESLDVIGGKLANASRTRNAKAAYDVRLAEELAAGTAQKRAEEIAIKDAVYAYNNVLPNYARISNLSRQLNAAVPYFSASIAGTRSLLNGLNNNPGVAISAMVGGVIAPSIATTAYSLSNDDGQAFYQDMIDSKKQYVLDNNLVVIPPGVKPHKVTKEEALASDGKRKEGEWEGVVLIPLPPEYRSLNQALWRGTHDAIMEGSDQQLSPQRVALSLGDFVTGGVRTSTSPVVQTGKALAGIDPYSSILSGNSRQLARSGEEVTGGTSRIAKAIGGATGIDPIRVDAVINQFGITGDILQEKKSTPLKTVSGAFRDKVYGPDGRTVGRKFFDDAETERNSLRIKATGSDAEINLANKTSAERQAVFDAYLNKSVEKGDPWYSQQFATLLIGHPEVAAALTRLYRKQENHQPFFDLPPDQQQQILRLRAETPHWNGLGSPADEAYSKFVKRNPWYKEFQKKQSSYFDNLPQDVKDKMKSEDTGTFYVQPSATVEQKFAQLEGITDPKARSEFYKNNPDVTDYLNQQNVATQRQRDAMGLFRDVTPQQEAGLVEYNRRKNAGLSTKGITKAFPELSTYFDVAGGISDQSKLIQRSNGATVAETGSLKSGSSSGSRRSRRSGGVKKVKPAKFKGTKAKRTTTAVKRVKAARSSGGGSSTIKFGRTRIQ